MTTLYSKVTGNWSTLGTFNTLANGTGVDTVPLNTHDVVVQSGHTVTLNTIGLVALSLTINSGGTVVAATAATSAILVQNGVANNGTLTLDMGSDVTKTCTFKVNNSRGTNDIVTTAASVTFKGFVKTRWCRLSSALVANTTKSVNVTDATGWQVGDRLVFIATDPITAYGQAPHTDKVTIATITLVSGTVYTVTWTDGTGTGGAVKYAHATNSHVGNFSSNLIIGPATSGDGTCIFDTGNSVKRQYTDVQFESLGSGNGFLHTGVSGNVQSAAGDKVSNCAFYNFSSVGIGFSYGNTAFARDRNIYYTLDTNANAAISGQPSPTDVGPDTDMVIFNVANGNGYGVFLNRPGMVLTRPTISGCLNAISSSVVDSAVLGGSMFSNSWPVGVQSNQITLTGTNIGKEFAGAKNWQVAYEGDFGQRTLIDCPMDTTQTIIGSGYSALPLNDFINIVDKDASVIAQEIYRPYGTIKRDNTVTKRSTSSVAIKPTTLAIDTSYTASIPCANGATVRVVGYCKADTSFFNASGSPHVPDWTAPTVTLSGLGIVPVAYTAGVAAENAFEFYDISATNSSGADGNFTLTFNANAKVVTTGTVYFDGVPTNSPFVTKARHYGFTFDQTLPNATVNSAVSASEATAAAYVGITVLGSTSGSPVETTSPITVTADQTFQKLYDYTQAWSCLHLADAVPVSSPVQGVLVAASHVTINTGKKVNGSGSIAMGAYTLTTEFTGPIAYTFTGGTWAQSTTVPSFTGGTLNLGVEGVFVFTAADTIIKMSPTSISPTPANPTYNFGSGTFTGTVDLRNTNSGQPITVALPSGTTYTTANNTGAAITVTTPPVTQSVTVNGLVAGSRVQIYDTTFGSPSGIELFNGIVAGTSKVWSDPNPAVVSRAIRVRIAKVSGATAYSFVEANIGTCGITTADSSLTYLASQSLDTSYNSNAIDGSTVTGITITPSPQRVKINLAGGTISWPSIYAYQVYWLSGAVGIADEAAFINAVDTANYLLTGFDIRNDSATPLTLTGGWGRDATTLTVAGCIDVAGSTGNIYAEPDHVVAYATGSALTAGQAASLSAIESATGASGSVNADVKKMNAVTVKGTGVAGDLWRG